MPSSKEQKQERRDGYNRTLPKTNQYCEFITEKGRCTRQKKGVKCNNELGFYHLCPIWQGNMKLDIF